MWRLRTGAKEGYDPHLCSTNNFLGRQIWEFDPDAGSPEELSEVDEARRKFADNRSEYKASADLLWRMQVKTFNRYTIELKLVQLIWCNYNFCFQIQKFLREKKFEQKIPRVIVEDAGKITYEDAKTALRRGIHYMAALQTEDGHWPAENGGCMYFNAPFVSCTFQYYFI